MPPAPAGGVGEIIEEDQRGEKVAVQKVDRVEIPEMAAIIRGIVREEIEWQDEPYWGTQVPARCEDVNLSRFDLDKFYTQQQIDDYVDELRRERLKHLHSFNGLNPEIINAFKL